jgi:hypothetical protein
MRRTGLISYRKQDEIVVPNLCRLWRLTGARTEPLARPLQRFQIGNEIVIWTMSSRNSGMVGWPVTMPSDRASARFSTG